MKNINWDRKTSLAQLFIGQVALLGLLITAFGTNTVRASSPRTLDDVFTQISNLYSEVIEGGIVDEHYWIGFGYQSPAWESTLTQAKQCQNASDFKAISRAKIAEAIRYEVTTGIDLAFASDREKQQALILELDQALQAFEKQLKGTKLSICSVLSLPDYSDGHKTRIVRSGDKNLFVFEVGYPD
jgi:hypothetical protein